MIITKMEIVEFGDIKELINSVSKKYNNFKDFSIVNNLSNKGKYIVYLNFYDKDVENNEECIQIEVIRNVIHREVNTVIKNAENDFDNFIGQDIIENIEKSNFVDVILKYKAKRNLNKFNLTHLKKWSSGHDFKTNISDVYFKITYYDPTDMYSLVKEEKTDKELCIESDGNDMIISLFDLNKAIILGKEDERVKDILYFIEYNVNTKEYVIYRYDEEGNKNWSGKRVVVEEIKSKNINTKELSYNILEYLQDEFDVIIDKNSKIRFEEELKMLIK